MYLTHSRLCSSPTYIYVLYMITSLIISVHFTIDTSSLFYHLYFSFLYYVYRVKDKKFTLKMSRMYFYKTDIIACKYKYVCITNINLSKNK